METYEVGDSQHHVKLEVQAGVVGIAVSRVYLREDGAYKKKFDSEPDSGGHIPFTKVGVNSTLDGKILRVRTLMDLSNLKPEQRQKAINSIYILYTLQGGPLGNKTFEVNPIEIDTTDPLRVLVTKKIRFQ